MLRVGIGYDLHRLAPGRKLMLGGLEIAFERGLVGHSDADVVLHAVSDALLGAAGLPDIGDLFPDNDPTYRDADSRGLLREVQRRVDAAGWKVVNVDIVVHAEAPKLGSLKRRIAESIAGLLDVLPNAVNVKGKTNEGVGPVGRGEAIACTAVALIEGTGNTS